MLLTDAPQSGAMLKRVSSIAPIVAAATSCATIPIEQRVTPNEVELACELTRGLGSQSFVETPANKVPPELVRFSEMDKSMVWKPLPRSLRCASGRRRITHLNEEGFGSFIDSMGVSRDGSVVAISGGYQIGELMGGGGVCYFERRDARWVRVGCTETWAS